MMNKIFYFFLGIIVPYCIMLFVSVAVTYRIILYFEY